MLHPPTDAETVRLFDLTLSRSGFGRLPADFGFLLTLACGLQGPYCILLGPGGMPMPGGEVEPGIYQASDGFNVHEDADEKKLVLGRASGNALLIFGGGQYQLLDAQTREVLRTYDGVADFIDDMVAMKGRGLEQPAS